MTINPVLSFIGNFFLTHLLWIAPLFSMLFFDASIQTAIKIAFIAFIITLIYNEFKHQKNQKKFSVREINTTTSNIYWVVMLLFLTLTGIATYKGIVGVFGVQENTKLLFIGALSVGIAAALLVITLMVKQRKKSTFFVFALVLYILFDFLVALPFNYLYFYDKLERTNYIENNEKNIELALKKADSIYKPMIAKDKAKQDSINEIIKSKENRKNQVTTNASNDAKLLSITSNKLDEDLETGNNIINTNNRIANNAKSKINNSINILNNEIERLEKQKLNLTPNLANYKKTDSLIKKYNKEVETITKIKDVTIKYDSITKLRKNVYGFLIGTKDSILVSISKTMYPEKKSSIKNIQQLYQYIFSQFSDTNNPAIKITRKNEDNAISNDEQLFLKKFSLSISIVIDILPLLLSILFAIYTRVE